MRLAVGARSSGHDRSHCVLHGGGGLARTQSKIIYGVPIMLELGRSNHGMILQKRSSLAHPRQYIRAD